MNKCNIMSQFHITNTDTYKLVTLSLNLPHELVQLIWKNCAIIENEPKWLSRLFSDDELKYRHTIPICSCISIYNNRNHTCRATENYYHECICYIQAVKSSLYISSNKCRAKTHNCICRNLQFHVKYGHFPSKHGRCHLYRCKYINICIAEKHACRCEEICISRSKEDWHNHKIIISCLANENDHNIEWRKKLDTMNGIYRSDIGAHRLRTQKIHKGSKAVHGKKNRKKGSDFSL